MRDPVERAGPAAIAEPFGYHTIPYICSSRGSSFSFVAIGILAPDGGKSLVLVED